MGLDSVGAVIEFAYQRPKGARTVLLKALGVATEARTISACCAGLELLGDVQAVASLQAYLVSCPQSHVWEVCHCLWRLGVAQPLLSFSADIEMLREASLHAVQSRSQPSIAIQKSTRSSVEFDVSFGEGLLRIDYDLPTRGTKTWARWSRSLYVAGEKMYSLGSLCGTCETILVLLGWPAQRALAVGTERSAEMAAGSEFDSAWIQRWAPVLHALQTGHYVAEEFSMEVELVPYENSWMALRKEFRKRDDPDSWYDDDDDESMPAQSLLEQQVYQGPMFKGAIRSHWSVLPSQNRSELDEERVRFYMQEIRNGTRPTILALGWMEQRYVEAAWDERFVALCILDGHHKLEAYSRCGVKANWIALFRLENSCGFGKVPTEPLRSALDQLGSEKGLRSADALSEFQSG